MFNEPEKRNSRRVPWSIAILGSVLPPLAVSETFPITVTGTTENISKDGVAILCEARLATNAILRCECVLPGSSLSIPTLLQVRWSDVVELHASYRVGLKFLL